MDSNNNHFYSDTPLQISSDRILVEDLEEDSRMGMNFKHPALSPETTTNTSKLVNELREISSPNGKSA